MQGDLQALRRAGRLVGGGVALAGWAAGCGAPLVDTHRGVANAPATEAAPPGTAASAVERVPLSRVLPSSKTGAPATYHEVQSGETWSGLAAKYHVTAERLIQANGFDSRTPLAAGQLIYIPTAASRP